MILTISEKWEDSPEFCELLKTYIKNPKGFFLMAGRNGNGKSYVSKKIKHECGIFDSDYNIFYTQFDLNAAWHKQIKDWGEVTYLFNNIVKANMLILDDLGAGSSKLSDAFLDFILAIVDKRYENRASTGTVITTNLNAKAMREKLGDALVSRVASGHCIRFEGQDRRITEF